MLERFNLVVGQRDETFNVQERLDRTERRDNNNEG